MGGSSCVIVSLISVLFNYYYENVTNYELIIYLLSLIANNNAQNKIGSGFDISTCIFGSQLFSRINSNLLEKLVEKKLFFQLKLLFIFIY